jgi:cytochrome c5
MHKIRTLFLILFLSLLASSVAVACAGGGEPAEPTPAETLAPSPAPSVSGPELLQDRCTQCHSLDRVTAASKTQAEWEATVARMRDKGAELTDEEAQILTEYLAETYGP